MAGDGRHQHAFFQLHVLQRRVQHGLAGVAGHEFRRLHRAAQQLVQALHGAAAGVGQGPDVAGDLVCHNILGGDDAGHAHLLHHVHVVGPGHLGDHLVHAAALGVHGHQQVFLVPSRQGDKGVGAVDVLLLQKVAVGAVALNHHHVGQRLRQRQALLLVLLHQAHADARLFQLLAQVLGNAAAAQNGRRAHRLPLPPDGVEHLLQLRLGAQHVHVVAAAWRIAAVGDDKFLPPLHAAEQHLGVVLA